MNYTPDTSLCRLIILQLARSASPQGETGERRERGEEGGGEAAAAVEVGELYNLICPGELNVI